MRLRKRGGALNILMNSLARACQGHATRSTFLVFTEMAGRCRTSFIALILSLLTVAGATRQSIAGRVLPAENQTAGLQAGTGGSAAANPPTSDPASYRRITVPGRRTGANDGVSCDFIFSLLPNPLPPHSGNSLFPYPLRAAGGAGFFDVSVTPSDGEPLSCPYALSSPPTRYDFTFPGLETGTIFGSRVFTFNYSSNSGRPRVGGVRVSFGSGFFADVAELQAAPIAACGEVNNGGFRPLPFDSTRAQSLYAFDFSANAGDAVTVSWDTPSLTGVTDSQGYVNAFFGGREATALARTGTYTLLFESSSLSGSYTISLQFTKGGSCAVPIACGQTLNGTLGVPYKMNAYRFSANAGEAVMPVSSATSNNFSPNAVLYRPDGQKLGNVSSDSGESRSLPATGTYTILVFDSQSNRTGTYDIGLQFTTGRCAQSIACGQLINAVPYVKSQFDSFKFSGTAGQQVGLFLNSGVGGNSLNRALYDPDGQRVTGETPGITGTTFGGGAETWTLPKTGDYTYLVSPSDPTVGLPSSGFYDLYRPCPGSCTAQLLYNHDVGSTGSYSLPALGGDDVGVYLIGSVAVLTGPGCSWSSASNATWMRIISGASQSKLWFLTFQADQNPSASPRTGTLTIAGQTFTVRQTGTCPVSLSLSGNAFSSGGGSGTLNVSSSSGCSWSAVSPGWISVSSAASSGNGSIGFSVTPFTGPFSGGSRIGKITVNNSSLTVRQTGTCGPISLSPASQSFGPAGGTGTINITAPSDCGWSFQGQFPSGIVEQQVPWLGINNGVTATTGNGSMGYRIDPFSGGSSRLGTFVISGQTFTVTQAASGPCSYALDFSQESFGAGGGLSTVRVVTAAGCPWQLTSNDSWISTVAPSSGNGSGTASYRVDAWNVQGQRQGTIGIVGKTFTVTQEGLGCIYSVSSRGKLFGATGGSGSVVVTSISGCSWKATSSDSWLTVSSGSSGTGNGSVGYSVASNSTSSNRTGTLTIAGQTFTVLEAGTTSQPQISAVRADPLIISPNGDGTNDLLTLEFNLSAADSVTARIFDNNGAVVATLLNAASLAAGAQSVSWDGTATGGVLAPDGVYSYSLQGAAAAAVTGNFGVNRTIPDAGRAWFIAEGSTVGFDAYILVQNPNPISVPVTVTFLKQDGTTQTYSETAGPLSRITVPMHREVPNTFSVSAFVDSPYPILVERSMYFSAGNAGTDSPGIVATSKNWYFPFNDTFVTEEAFILIANTSDTNAQVTVAYLFDSGPPATQNYTVIPHSRFTVPVHGYFPNKSVSVQLTADIPVAAEQSFYISNRAGGTAGIGAVMPSLTWYFADGDTSALTTNGTAASTRLDIMNPGSTAASVTISYLLENGTVLTKTQTVGAQARVALDPAATVGAGQRFSIQAVSTVPLVMGRLILSGTDLAATIGSPTTDTNWYLAEGFTAFGYETWIVVSNPGTTTASVKARFHKQNTQNIVRYYTVAAKQRLTIYVNSELDEETSVSSQITSDQPVTVERTMKFSSRRGIHQAMGIR